MLKIVLTILFSISLIYSLGQNSKLSQSGEPKSKNIADSANNNLFDQLLPFLDTTISSEFNQAVVIASYRRFAIKKDWIKPYRIIGYECPDTLSKKSIVFTNPKIVNFKLGEEDDTNMEHVDFVFLGIEGDFVKVKCTLEGELIDIIYFERKMVRLKR